MLLNMEIRYFLFCLYFFLLFYIFFFFFFFQAEDGIRDLYVTGVQTCALPISLGLFRQLEWSIASGGDSHRWKHGSNFQHYLKGEPMKLYYHPISGHEIGRASCRERV